MNDGQFPDDDEWRPFTFEGRALEWLSSRGAIEDHAGWREVEDVFLRRSGCLSTFLAHHVAVGTSVDETHAIAAARLFFDQWAITMIANVEEQLTTCEDDARRALLMATLTHGRVIASWRPLVDFDATMRRASRLMLEMWGDLNATTAACPGKSAESTPTSGRQLRASPSP